MTTFGCRVNDPPVVLVVVYLAWNCCLLCGMDDQLDQTHETFGILTFFIRIV